MAIKLLESQSGTIGGVYNSNPTINPDMTQRTFFCWGNFAEAVVHIEYSPDGEEWFRDKTAESTFTEKDLRTLEFAVGVWVRAVIENAAAGTIVHLWMF